MALLFRDTFLESPITGLRFHVPTPNGGPGWSYLGTDLRYQCNPGAFVDGAIGSAGNPDIGRNAFVIPPGVTRWRIQGDVTRGAVDAGVGGGFSLAALVSPEDLSTWDIKNYLRLDVARRDAGKVNVSATYVRPALPAGPVGVTLRSASVAHASGARRYILEVDQLAGTVELFKADADTGPTNENETLIDAGETDPVGGSGLFTAELTDHVTNDVTHRLIGIHGGWTATGITYFAAGELQVWSLDIPTVGPPCTFLFDVFEEDRTTIAWSVATNQLHPFPYLEQPEDYAEQEIDIAKGAATIGTVGLTIIDKGPPGDQDGGFLMDKLATLAGRRGRLTHFDDLSNPVVVIDGPISLPTMADYPAFRVQVQDTRETERALPIFDTILPTIDVSDDEADTTPTTGGTDGDILWNTDNH